MHDFNVAFDKEQAEPIIMYNDIMNYIQRENNKKTVLCGSFEESWHTKVPSIIDIMTTRTVSIMSALNGEMATKPMNV